MARAAWVLVLLVITLAADLIPTLRLQAFDQVLAVHRAAYQKYTRLHIIITLQIIFELLPEPKGGSA